MDQAFARSLVESLKAHHRRQFVHLMEKLDAMPGMDRTILWYGPSWKWTIVYNLNQANGHEAAQTNGHARTNGKSNGHSLGKGNGNGNGNGNGKSNGNRSKSVTPAMLQPQDVFCFLVPNIENPSVCIPLAETDAESIAGGTLSRYLREGINTAKCAVATRWATWTPATENESTQLADLLKKETAIGQLDMAARMKIERSTETHADSAWASTD
ncbi:MAG: hypothetical protein HC898_08320 [Phycisphaerales bacterium]|nr:hypothetical protein [Phycisphaerales bacterium]